METITTVKSTVEKKERKRKKEKRNKNDRQQQTTKFIIYVCGLSGAGKSLLLHRLTNMEENVDKKEGKLDKIEDTYSFKSRYDNPSVIQTIGSKKISLVSQYDDKEKEKNMENYEIIFEEIGYSPVTRMKKIGEQTKYPVCGVIYIIPTDIPHVSGNISFSIKEHEEHLKNPNSYILEKNSRMAKIRNYFLDIISEPKLVSLPMLILLNCTNPCHFSDTKNDFIQTVEIMELLQLFSMKNGEKKYPFEMKKNENNYNRDIKISPRINILPPHLFDLFLQ